MLGVLVLAVLTWGLNQGGFSGGGRDGDADPAAVATVALTSLPAEAQHTLVLIDAGGPFPYDRDGVVFENREGLLPAEQSGYYHEYTVPTPGAADRGARRIITGDAGELYWTGDHYRTFARIER
jgi:ribonuclease T1